MKNTVSIPLEPIEKKRPSVFSKEFYKRWRKGIKEATPEQQLNAKIIGHKGAIIGLSIAALSLIYKVIMLFDWTQLGFVVFLIFIIWLQKVEYTKTKQQQEGMKAMMEQMKEQEEIKSEKILGGLK